MFSAVNEGGVILTAHAQTRKRVKQCSVTGSGFVRKTITLHVQMSDTSPTQVQGFD